MSETDLTRGPAVIGDDILDEDAARATLECVLDGDRECAGVLLASYAEALEEIAALRAQLNEAMNVVHVCRVELPVALNLLDQKLQGLLADRHPVTTEDDPWAEIYGTLYEAVNKISGVWHRALPEHMEAHRAQALAAAPPASEGEEGA